MISTLLFLIKMIAAVAGVAALVTVLVAIIAMLIKGAVEVTMFLWDSTTSDLKRLSTWIKSKRKNNTRSN